MDVSLRRKQLKQSDGIPEMLTPVIGISYECSSAVSADRNTLWCWECYEISKKRKTNSPVTSIHAVCPTHHHVTLWANNDLHKVVVEPLKLQRPKGSTTSPNATMRNSPMMMKMMALMTTTTMEMITVKLMKRRRRRQTMKSSNWCWPKGFRCWHFCWNAFCTFPV